MADDPRGRMTRMAARLEMVKEIEAVADDLRGQIAILQHKVDAIDEIVRRTREAEQKERRNAR